MEKISDLASRFCTFLASHPLHRPKCTFGALYGSAHFSYFSFAFFEGHGLYSLTAGGLALLMVFGLFLGEDVA